MAVGLDLAKNVFHLIGCDTHGKEVKRKILKRGQLIAYLADLSLCLIGMDACAGSHYRVREVEKLGHEARLNSPSTHAEFYVRGNTCLPIIGAIPWFCREGETGVVGRREGCRCRHPGIPCRDDRGQRTTSRSRSA